MYLLNCKIFDKVIWAKAPSPLNLNCHGLKAVAIDMQIVAGL